MQQAQGWEARIRVIDFIFMFTRQDQTVEDCLATFEAIKGVGVGHLGFKDVGVDRETLRELNRRIKASGHFLAEVARARR